ncbi:MAG: AMP-binding protein [Deltaproteobacteria bacterium]|nr:AMP-binding protein [Deltaproteobacteria bacterium]
MGLFKDNSAIHHFFISAFSFLILVQPAFAKDDKCKGPLTAIGTQPSFIRSITLSTLQKILKLRYHIQLNGLENISSSKNGKGTLLLPQHPGLIDPPIVLSTLDSKLRPRPVMAESVLGYPAMKWIAEKLKAVIIPDLSSGTKESMERAKDALKEIIEGIDRGENFLLYPSGHITKSAEESLGNRSGVKQILDAVPNANIAVLKIEGLWGSSFTFGATGKYPNAKISMLRGIPFATANGIFFGPKRNVSLTLVDASDFPRQADVATINRFLEKIYNSKVLPNTWVPYYGLWQGRTPKTLPEPTISEFESKRSAEAVPENIKNLVILKIQEILKSKNTFSETMKLQDLGLDSLSKVDLILWIEKQSGVQQSNPDSILTVADCMLAMNGQVLSGDIELKAVPQKWKDAKPQEFKLPTAKSVAEAFLDQALRQPNLPVVADQMKGVLTNRDLLTAVFILKPLIEKMPGDKIGLMLPASVGADVFLLAAQFAGKIPVQLNWTVGERNLQHMIESQGIQKIVTAQALIDKLEGQGVNLSALQNKFFLAESLGTQVTLKDKIFARLATFNPFRIRGLRENIKDTSVILFTSGSENLPKAVPLSHENHLSNIVSALSFGALSHEDKMLGFLPPFHSFGSTVMQVAPLIFGIPVVYSPNPLDSTMLAKIVEAYGVTFTAGTPTFIKGMAEAATSEQLKSLRSVMTGGEALPDSVIELVRNKNSKIQIGEGYGITETGPIISANPASAIRRGSIGFPLPWVEFVLIHPETGAVLTEGRGNMDKKGNLIAPSTTHRDVEGILLVRGKSVMSNYLNYSGASPFQEIGGKSFYNTGDIVRMDADGYLFFKGRLKRFVKIGGEMVSMPAIETALLEKYSDSKEGPPLAVVADETKERAEFVVVSRNSLNVEEANRYLFEKGFSGLSRISRIIQVSELPTLGTGKTNYRELKKLAESSQK